MTQPIKPTGSSPLGGPSPLDQLDALDKARQSEAVQGTAQAQAAEAAKAGGAVQSPSAQVIDQLRAGEISRGEAIDALVSQALERHGAARLSAAKQTELAGVLRGALLEDPALGALLGS